MIEQWKRIQGYENYEISNYGVVRNVNTNKIMSQSMRNNYKRVGLFSAPKQKDFDIHRLVAEHFLPVPSKELILAASKTKLKTVVVNHIDGNKTNNRSDNLEWTTYSDNVKHSYDVIGRNTSSGEKHYNSKLTEENVLEIRKLYSDNPKRGMYAELSRKFKVSNEAISRIINRKSWKHI